jgi:hypothetical protein
MRIDVDWRSSRLSALPLMCQKATLAIALVALTAFGAHAAQVSAPARLHRSDTATASSPATRHATPVYSRHHTTPAHTRSQTPVSTTRKPTPRESGRTAGLAIRRDLAQKQAARRNVALRVERSSATPRAESERALPSNKETRTVTGMEVASASPVFLLRPARAEEPARAKELDQPEASVRNRPRAATQALAPTMNDGGTTNEEMDSAEHQGPRKGSLTADGNSPARSENAGVGTSRVASPTHATPDAETPDAKTEDASLRIQFRSNPAPLRGSHESLERQNTRLDAEGLERIEDESDLVDRIAHKLLVPIPTSSGLTVNAELALTHRYCRPWTALFLTDLSRAHDAAFHRPLEVSSAVRTMEYQKRLMEINGNAAPAEGDIVSPHLTGATIDLAKDGLSRAEISWMRRRLLTLETAGKIDVEEEFRQACFHITVYKDYAPPRTPHPATQAGSGSAGPKHHKAVEPTGPAAAQGL